MIRESSVSLPYHKVIHLFFSWISNWIHNFSWTFFQAKAKEFDGVFESETSIDRTSETEGFRIFRRVTIRYFFDLFWFQFEFSFHFGSQLLEERTQEIEAFFKSDSEDDVQENCSSNQPTADPPEPETLTSLVDENVNRPIEEIQSIPNENPVEETASNDSFSLGIIHLLSFFTHCLWI